MMLLLQCPKCKKQMKYHTKDMFLSKKRKACVYCGKSFKVKDNLIKKLA